MLRTLGLLIIAACSAGSAAPAIADALRVDGGRLNATMERMKTFGRAESGGSNRVAFSTHNRDALAYLEGLLQDAGLMTHVDVAGNLVGRHDGRRALPPIVIGSHIDTVPDGGHYDGMVGVMAAIEVAQTLRDNGTVLDHPLELVVWSNEEGGKTGSRSWNGSVTTDELDLPSLGERTLGDGMRFLGGNPERLRDNVRKPGDIAAYLELHVEQGFVLDRADIDIGVVDGIVGIRRWNVHVDGFANHAGTTPMDQRQDALYAAAQIVTAVRDVTGGSDGRQVGTVGRIRAEPGAPNVIPGAVVMSLEVRDLDMDRIETLFQAIRRRALDIADDTGTTVRFEQFYESPAALTDPEIGRMVAASAEALGLSQQHLPSGAGHDAQSLAPLAPIGMIFVPSADGISHAPSEFTSAEAITNGANVLLQTLLALDRRANDDLRPQAVAALENPANEEQARHQEQRRHRD